MIDQRVFQNKLLDLSACLSARAGTVPEWSRLLDGYDAAMTRAGVEQVDFVEACDRIIVFDDWFPTAARIIAVAGECRDDRARRARAAAPDRRFAGRIVCATCAGARMVRLGGYSPLGALAGADGARSIPCPTCSTYGYNRDDEQTAINREGGVPDPGSDAGMPDLDKRTWAVPRDANGRMDAEAWYRESRVLRDLDPNVDERPPAVPGFMNAGAAWKGPNR